MKLEVRTAEARDLPEIKRQIDEYCNGVYYMKKTGSDGERRISEGLEWVKQRNCKGFRGFG